MRTHPKSAPPKPGTLAGFLFLLSATLPAFLLPAPATGQMATQAEARTIVTAEDFGRFENLGTVQLSPRGDWVAASISRVEDDGEVRIRPATGGETRVVENGTFATFSADGAWVAVTVQPPQAERRRLQEQNTPVRNDLLLLRLGTTEEVEIEAVQSYLFSPDGRYLLMRRYRSGGGNQDHRGADVVVRELASGVDVNFGNVSESQWAPEGATLAMVVDAANMSGNGVRLFDAESGRIRTLHSQPARFTQLTWRDDSRDLALLRTQPDEERGDTVYSIVAWQDVDRGSDGFRELDGAVSGGARGELRITGVRGLTWADDGSRLFFGLQERGEGEDEGEEVEEEVEAEAEEEVEEESDGEPTRIEGEDEPPGVEIWHARDVDPVPQQRLWANQERNRSSLGTWTLSGAAVVLGGEGLDESISVTPDQGAALLMDTSPYAPERMFGPIYQDVYRVDLATGQRTRVAERIEHFRGVSPGGRYFLHFAADDYWIHDLETGEVRNLTGDIPAVFTNEQVDVVVPQKPPYGVGGWTEGDQHVLLYDQYDIWRVSPDGSEAERLTQGAENDVRHRLVSVDLDDDHFPAGGPWWVTLYGEWTKDSGYGRLVPGRDVEELVFEDRGISRLMKADSADVYGYVTQRYHEPPVLHLADANLGSARPVIGVNEFVGDEYLWGRSELVDYENEWGVRLQGILTYPANYQPGRQYPMIVYHYERLSQGLHSWMNPTQRSAYNVTAFTQNGYFVLRPDIVYRPRNPGLSFMESVLPAVDAAVATGLIDEDRIGITGHSWGGYQTTFAVTQTDRFAAAVAGAPLTNLVSMYLSFYWNSGSTDARIFEISQGRMEVPWWEDFDSYRANSPVHHITRMNTPLLMAFGDEDGAVEFNQGVEFYNAARRVGSDFVLLVYEGENHGLAQRPNQMDYYRRTHEWFDHYLKGEPAPAWITEGVRYVDQQEKLKEGPAAGRRPAPRAGGGG